MSNSPIVSQPHKKGCLALNVMIDALGAEILSRHPFCHNLAPTRKPLGSVFGYSSTCIPSILSGRWPESHYNWCYFVHDPQHSPFRHLRFLRFLPRAITSRRIFRRRLSLLVKRWLRFQGYFDLYNIPFEWAHLYDFSERKSPLQPNGMNKGRNIFDELVGANIPYYVSDPDISEEANWQLAKTAVASRSVDYVFLYWPALDGLMHMETNASPNITPLLAKYERWIGELVSQAQAQYSEVRLNVFSDHGMATCTEHVDVQCRVSSLPLVFGKDYSVVYDSTMARFWFFTDAARQLIIELLSAIPEGRILPEQELRDLHAYFPDHRFGELIYLMREGALIVPSHMGQRSIPAMHGYHPSDPQSFASFMSNRPVLPEFLRQIPDIYRVMWEDAQYAHRVNGGQA